ncbi:MAG: hypothetical protein JETCAE03_33120 [Ignavibacteriaceae bacterium]|jgi:hypothetical protein|nr:MAG: hypothetical protein JETCAE03_33120 [Ignavibacteriaceae bacterium]
MPTPIDKNIDAVIYKELANPKKMEFANEKKPVLKQADYDRGYFTRYFLRQVNNPLSKILEVDKAQFNKFKSEPFYINLDMNWKLTGDLQSIIDTNYNILVESDKKLPGIKKLLENKLLEFTKLH